MAKRQTKTPEQRKAETEALHGQLAAEVEKLRNSDEWASMLRGVARLRRYSLNNLLLILSVCPEASDVRSFNAWKKEGRSVRKGEKAIRIFRPMTIEVEDEGADEKRERVIFRPFPVFDVSQTDPTAKAGAPTDELQTTPDMDPAEVYRILADDLTEQGWSVSKVAELGGAQGRTNPSTHTVRILDSLTPAAAAATLMHEAAHIELGHVKNVDEYHQCRGRAEVAAESVAYVVASALGIETADSVPYVAGWQDGPEGTKAIEETAADVIAAARNMLIKIDTPNSAAHAA